MNLLNKSKTVLKSLQIKNGGILATPINGAYPYVYTRDAVIITKALNKVGLEKNSEKFYYFIKKYSKLKNYKEVFQRYTHNGYPSVTRRHENDNEGLLLHGIFDTFKKNKDETFLENMWTLVDETAKLLLSYSKSGLVKTKRSIHEYSPLEEGHEIWSSSAAVRGLLDAAKIAEILNHKKESKEWLKKANEIKKNIDKKLFNKKTGIYIKNPKYPNSPDMSVLAPFYFQIADNKTILKKSLNHLKKHLWNTEHGGFRRFRKFEVVNDWHWYTGGSGSWVFLTCWAARFYKTLNDKKNYKECLSWIEKVGKKSNGFLPEHIATKEEYEEWKRNEIEFSTRIINETKKSEKSMQKIDNKKIVYWACPLGWSHAEYILLKHQ